MGPEDAVAALRENASRLAAIVAGVAHERLHTPPAQDEWSPNDVLAHMRACCDVWGGNIEKILASEHATFAGINPRTWIKKTDYPAWEFEAALRAFQDQRAKLLVTLEGLGPAAWERTATVRAYGQTNERSLISYATQLAMHERTHVRQIEKTVEGPGTD